MDIIGGVAILRIPPDLQHRKRLIGEIILSNLSNVKTVYAQVSPVSGEYRVRSLELIAGEEQELVRYREHGAEFFVDPKSVYFTPRLSNERIRIARLVRENEVIVNLFGGVGTYSIIIAKHRPTSRNYTIDSNPRAHYLALRNIELNRLSGRVTAIEGDCREVVRDHLMGKASRVLMPLPEMAADYLETADSVLRPEGGWVHYYAHVGCSVGEDPVKKAHGLLADRIPSAWRLSYATRLRDVGPRRSEVVLDFEVR